MKRKDLESLGFKYAGNKQYPHRYSIPFIGLFDIEPKAKLDDVFSSIFNRGKEVGIKEGKDLKVEEIKQVLGIYNFD